MKHSRWFRDPPYRQLNCVRCSRTWRLARTMRSHAHPLSLGFGLSSVGHIFMDRETCCHHHTTHHPQLCMERRFQSSGQKIATLSCTASGWRSGVLESRGNCASWGHQSALGTRRAGCRKRRAFLDPAATPHCPGVDLPAKRNFIL